MRPWWLALFSVFIAGCSSDPEEPTPSPKARCETLIDTYCARSADCAVSEGIASKSERDSNYQNCLSSERMELPCEKVTEISGTYDQCIGALRKTACQTFLLTSMTGMAALPSDCDGVAQLGP